MGEFILQTSTGLHETDTNFNFLLAPNLDLYAIKKNNSDTRSTEVAVLSASSNYQRFTLQTGTPLHETDNSFEFLLAPNLDIFAVKKNNTDTQSTEVAILSASSNYQSFILQTGTALHETGSNFQFTLASNRDLVSIKKSLTDTRSTEVAILSASSNYQAFSLQTGTALHETGDNFEFAFAQNNDLFAIKKNCTDTRSTEVSVLTAATNYQQFGMQIGTPLHETDHTFSFTITPDRNLFSVKKRYTGTCSTEVHVLTLP